MEELVFGYIDKVSNGAPIKKQSLLFTNEYEVSLKTDKVGRIENIIINPIENILDDLYPKCIQNINVLVGINGSGKTTLLDILGSGRHTRKMYQEQWRFFLLYKVDHNRFVIEGNGLGVIRNIPEMDEFILEGRGSVSNEYSLEFQYDFSTNKIRNIRYCNSGDWEETRILYYKDRTDEMYDWQVSEQEYTDAPVFVERKSIRPSMGAIYKYTQDILGNSFEERKGLINMDNLDIRISFNEQFDFPCNRHKIDQSNYLSNYLLATAFYLIKYGYYYSVDDKAKKFAEELSNAMRNNSFSYTDSWMEDVYQALERYLSDSYEDKTTHLLKKLKEVVGEAPKDYFLQDAFNLVDFSLETIHFKVNSEENKNIVEVLQLMDEVNADCQEFYKMQLSKLSAGETKTIDVFSSISANISDEAQHYIVVLDEPDKGMHPELSRSFIERLVRHAEYLNKQHGCTFQFVITTHSPYFLSDVPKDNIHCLIRNEKGVAVENSKMGLLSCIPDIMRNTFFLNSPFGERANYYFSVLQKRIDNLTKEGNYRYELERLQKIIDDLDEPTIKMFLKNALDSKIKEFVNIDSRVRQELIEYHQREIARLKGQKND